MEYRHIVAVTGLSGLYQLLNSKKDGAIVKSLSGDNAVKFVSSRLHSITPIESIEIYTYDDVNVKLHEVFESAKAFDAEVLQMNQKRDDKNAKELFEKILPNFDQDRVYSSDIRKVYKWYEILKSNDLLNFEHLKQDANTEDAENTATVSEAENVATEEVKEAAPKKAAAKKAAAKKATAKKAEAKNSDEVADGATEAKPKKNAAPKKAAKKKEE